MESLYVVEDTGNDVLNILRNYNTIVFGRSWSWTGINYCWQESAWKTFLKLQHRYKWSLERKEKKIKNALSWLAHWNCAINKNIQSDICSNIHVFGCKMIINSFVPAKRNRQDLTSNSSFTNPQYSFIQCGKDHGYYTSATLTYECNKYNHVVNIPTTKSLHTYPHKK